MKILSKRLASRIASLAALTSTMTMAAGISAAHAADACANAALRTGPSAALPDCRAYELVSTDANHASNTTPAGRSSADGDTMGYQTIDAPENAQSASVFNMVRATRDDVRGWKGVSLSAPVPAQVDVYAGFIPRGFSADLSSTFVFSDQPLTGGSVQDGQNAFIGKADGKYQRVTNVASEPASNTHTYPSADFVWGNADFSRVYFLPGVAQAPLDPQLSENLYSWTEATGTRLVGVLPDGTPAPSGAGLEGSVLPPVSNNGKYALFGAGGGFYARVNDSTTIEPGASQRTVNPDPNPPARIVGLGITNDASKILFTSRSELTNDANTGESGGAATDAGDDIYRYDVASGTIEDLTVDRNAADAATGANVQTVFGASTDGSYIYFTATGVLAQGASQGHRSLYRWHEGHIEFIADADGITGLGGGQIRVYTTPDGRHFAFASTDRLTSYDNTDPVTGQPHYEVYESSVGSALQCASCRADGSQPTDDSYLPEYFGLSGGGIRDITDDGHRLFFHSLDRIVPQASSGVQRVYQYEDGRISPISRPDGSSAATFLDTSASGDDVFFSTYDELVPNADGGDQAVYDARVGGGFPVDTAERCSGVACQPSATAPALLPVLGSVSVLGEGNLQGGSSESRSSTQVIVSKVKAINGTAGSLKVRVPGKGRLTVSGSGLQTARSSVAKAQRTTVRLALTSSAIKALRREGKFKTKVRVAFSAGSGQESTVSLSLTFKAASMRKGA